MDGADSAECSLPDCSWSLHVSGDYSVTDYFDGTDHESVNDFDRTRFEYLVDRWDTPGAGFSQDGGSGDLRLDETFVRIQWTGEGVGVFENVTPGTEEGCPGLVGYDTCEVSGELTLTYE